MSQYKYIKWFSEGELDVSTIGGKGSSLGKMYCELAGEAGVPVPNGFCLTADAFRRYLQFNELVEPIAIILRDFHQQPFTQKLLEKTGNKVRGMVKSDVMPQELKDEILTAYHELCLNGEPVAVRSSATTEDSPEASFAGQHDTFLNTAGDEAVMEATQKCYASLFNDCAINYRIDKGFGTFDIALAVVFQRMVRSGDDNGASGVMFTLAPNSGHRNFIYIDSLWGSGNVSVGGQANSDTYLVSQNPKHAVVRTVLGTKHYKEVNAHDGRGQTTKVIETSKKERNSFSLTENDVLTLAGYGSKIQKHYKNAPMDIEWAKDGVDGKLYIVQARPETVESRKTGLIQEIYERILSEEEPQVIVSGASAGSKVGKGPVRVIRDLKDMHTFKKGEVLVMDMTTPDCEPIMKIASAIITNRGGVTCHAAIVSRELGIPAIVGCDTATEDLTDGQFVTASCAEGEKGFVYGGDVPFRKREIDMSGMELPKRTKLMFNFANPEQAIDCAAKYPCTDGVGLMRIEHTLLYEVGIHPQAILNYAILPKELQVKINERIKGCGNAREFYISKLSQAMMTIAAAVYPKPVIVRTTDLKTDEFAKLDGGYLYEKEEDNPLVGFRGVERYLDASYAPCFAMECEAIIRARSMGFSNIWVMLPFIRTPEDACESIELLAANGLDRKTDLTLKIIGMYEIPAMAFLVHAFLQYFDGFSIGSNDLGLLTFGEDRSRKAKRRDGAEVTHRALLVPMKVAIDACVAQGKYVGICGEAVSYDPKLAEFFVENGATSISVQHDRILDTLEFIVAAEKKFGLWS